MKKLTTFGALLLSAAFVFGQNTAHTNAAITPTAGESWLHHLHRPFGETSMGKTWRLGPDGLSADDAAHLLQSSTRSDATSPGTRARALHGSDLYRMNCQGCHGESGLGAPPEIASLIDPVRATSAVLVEERMKALGMELNRRQTAEMVSQSKGALLKRLHEGGTDMPSFHQLSEAEIRSLMAYLRQLAGVPGAESKQIAIQESDARVGELIVKSTCHICHDATGMNPTPAELLEGAIPPLSALPSRVNRAQLVRKVTSGAPVAMGRTSSLYRGRMPVFNYLTEDEAADVYDYLTHYPPTELANTSQTAQISPADSIDPPADPPAARAASLRPASQTAAAEVPIPREQTASVAFPATVESFVAVFLVLGCWFTLHECKRLSVESRARRASIRPGAAPAPRVTPRPRVEMAMDGASLRTEAEALCREFSDWWDEKKVSSPKVRKIRR